MTITAMRRITLLLALSLFASGCELIGDIFQAGFVVGIIIIVLIIAVIGWLIGRFRRG
jgi:hypothetical protein